MGAGAAGCKSRDRPFRRRYGAYRRRPPDVTGRIRASRGAAARSPADGTIAHSLPRPAVHGVFLPKGAGQVGQCRPVARVQTHHRLKETTRRCRRLDRAAPPVESVAHGDRPSVGRPEKRQETAQGRASCGCEALVRAPARILPGIRRPGRSSHQAAFGEWSGSSPPRPLGTPHRSEPRADRGSHHRRFRCEVRENRTGGAAWHRPIRASRPRKSARGRWQGRCHRGGHWPG